jgi:hypothetical protein
MCTTLCQNATWGAYEHQSFPITFVVIETESTSLCKYSSKNVNLNYIYTVSTHVA